MTVTDSAVAPGGISPAASVLGFRFIGWTIVGTLLAYLLNIYLNFWREWPGATAAFGPDATATAWLQVLIFALAVVGPAVFVTNTKHRTLRQDDKAIAAIAAYIARFAFWVVFLVGIIDLIRVAVADQDFANSEKEMIRDIGSSLNFAPEEIDKLVMYGFELMPK